MFFEIVGCLAFVGIGLWALFGSVLLTMVSFGFSGQLKGSDRVAALSFFLGGIVLIYIGIHWMPFDIHLTKAQ